MPNESDSDSTIMNITKAMNDFNSLQIRLNTDSILERYELFIRGERLTYSQNAQGMLIAIKDKIGAPKANERGIQDMLNWISGIVNPQVVQGNFLLDNKGFSRAYEDYMYHFRVDFMEYLMTNLYNFDIDETELQGIVDQAELMIRPFMTRLINNEERKGMGQTVKSDTSVVRAKKGGFDIFKK